MKHSNNFKQPIQNIMIFGDSYSTFAGYVPEGYAIYYSAEEREQTDVRRVEETWWHLLCANHSFKLVRNDSWSGSTLGNTGYSGDCSKTSSFIYRLEKLETEGFFREHEIDTVFIFGCTNDSWANAPLGEIKLNNFKPDDLFYVCPAIGYFIDRLKKILPDANIIFLINTDLKPEISDAVITASKYNGTDYIKFTFIDKRCGHPTIRGMRDIKEQIDAFLTHDSASN